MESKINSANCVEFLLLQFDAENGKLSSIHLYIHPYDLNPYLLQNFEETKSGKTQSCLKERTVYGSKPTE